MPYSLDSDRGNAKQTYNAFRASSIIGARTDSPSYARKMLRKAYRTAMTVSLERGAIAVSIPLLPPAKRLWTWSDSLEIVMTESKKNLDAMVNILVPDTAKLDVTGIPFDEVELPPNGGSIHDTSDNGVFSNGNVLWNDDGAVSVDIGDQSQFIIETKKRMAETRVSVDDMCNDANVSKQFISGMLNGDDRYLVTKREAVALACALEVKFSNVNDYIKLAGYSLTDAFVFDLVCSHYIGRKIYDVDEINKALFYYGQDILGSFH